MDLQSCIKPELWERIRNTYSSENYKNAIGEAMQVLTDMLREKSGLDGDGHDIVGKALGGTSPLIRVNNLQTETEKHEQMGMQLIVKGMYSAIRNPRSHGSPEDRRETADAIIYFIDYILRRLDLSEDYFTIEKFLLRITDPYFVQLESYGEALINEIPKNKIFDTLVEMYKEKKPQRIQNFALIIKLLLKIISDEQLTQFLAIVSDELKVVSGDMIWCDLEILPPSLWKRIVPIARQRIEHKVLGEISDGIAGEYNGSIRSVIGGRLATSARDFLADFDIKADIERIMLDKLSGDIQGRHYIVGYFMNYLYVNLTSEYMIDRFVNSIVDAVKDGDELTKKSLYSTCHDTIWIGRFVEELKEDIPDISDHFTDVPI